MCCAICSLFGGNFQARLSSLVQGNPVGYLDSGDEAELQEESLKVWRKRNLVSRLGLYVSVGHKYRNLYGVRTVQSVAFFQAGLSSLIQGNPVGYLMKRS